MKILQRPVLCTHCLVLMLNVAMVALADDVTFQDGILTFNVSSASEAAPYLYDAFPEGVEQIIKRGTGAVHLGSVTNAAFTGKIHIEGGFLMGYYSAFGTPTELRIEEGGALEIMDYRTLFGTAHSTSPTTAPFRNAKVYICGSGPDGNGAIQRPYADADWCDGYFSKYLELTGDAMLNLGSRWGFYDATFVMNNHTLSFSSEKHGTQFSFNYSPIFNFWGTKTIKHPGAFQLIGNTRFGYEGVNAVKDDPDSNGTITNMPCYLDDGAYMRAFQVTCPLPFKIISQGESTHLDSNQSGLANGHIIGDIEIESGSTLSLGSYYASQRYDAPLYLDGRVSGSGKLDATFTGPHFMTGSHTNVLRAISKTSADKFVLKDDITLIVTNGSDYGTSFMAFHTAISNAATFVLKDRARIMADPVNVKNSPRLQLGFNDNVWGSKGYGVLELWDNSIVSNCVSIGLSGAGAVYLFGGTLVEPHDGASGNSMGFGYAGYAYLGLNAGTFAERSWVQMGCNGNGRGFLVQRGGVARMGVDNSDLLRLGMGGNGSFATFAQFGGASYITNDVWFANNGDQPNSTYTIGTVTVDGTNTLMDAAGWNGFYVNANTNANPAAYTTSLVNLNNGGTLKVKRIVRGKYGNDQTYPWEKICADAKQFGFAALNFNGGVLKMARSGEFFDGSAIDHSREITRVTIYGAGAVLDTDGYDVTWRLPFTRPFGRGIRRVTLPDDARAAGKLIGPTRYWITDATGRGADMLMDFDDTNRVARGVIVTSPGCGYSENPIVVFEKADRSANDRWTATVETIDFEAADYVHGGFTKRGAGTLSLAGVNTYGGTTRVEAGTLKFLDANGYPAGSPLELSPGATVSFNGTDTTLTKITGAGKIRDANVTVTEGVSFYLADAATNACLTLTGKVTFGADSMITVCDPDKLDPMRKAPYVVVSADGGIVGMPTLQGLPDNWRVTKRGNAILVKRFKGLAILYR